VACSCPRVDICCVRLNTPSFSTLRMTYNGSERQVIVIFNKMLSCKASELFSKLFSSLISNQGLCR